MGVGHCVLQVSCVVCDYVENGFYLHSAYARGLACETWRDTSTTYDAEAQSFLHFVAKLRARNALCPGQIDHLAVLAEVVEFAFPVAANGKDVDTVFLHVVDFLAYIIFDDYLVGQTSSSHCFDALEHVVAHVELSSVSVEIIVRHAYYQSVAQCFSAT